MASPIDNELLPPSGDASKLPSLGSPEMSYEFLSKVKQILEGMLGRRGGSNWDRVVTFRDLYGNADAPGSLAQRLGGGFPATGQNLGLPPDQFRAITDQIDASIRNSTAYKALTSRIGSVDALASFPEEMRSQLSVSLGQLALQRQADIQSVDKKIQSADISFASRLTEITAALDRTAAGVRHFDAAYADRTRALSVATTTVTARIDNVTGESDPLLYVTLEEQFVAQADVNTGLLGQWTIKIQAGSEANPIVAGVALTVEDPIAGGGTSSFVILADKFAIYTSAGNANPFGVSGTTVYVNGTLKVGGASGPTLGTLTDGMINFVGDFSSAPTASSYRVNDVYKNTTDGHTYILELVSTVKTWVLWIAKGATGTAGTNGTNGSNGSNGQRGTVQIAASGYSAWSDSSANAALVSAGYGSPVDRDMVTLYNSTFSETRFYSSGSWLTITAWINGNMVVSGTLSCAALIADTLTGQTYKSASGTGARVTINESSNNKLKVYDASNNAILELGGTSGTLYVPTTATTVPAIYATNNAPTVEAISGSNSGAGPGVTGTSNSGYGMDAFTTSGTALRARGGTSGTHNAISADGAYSQTARSTGVADNLFNNVLATTDNTYACGLTGNAWASMASHAALTVISDERTKTDVEDSALGLSFIQSLRPVSYRMKVGHNEITHAPVREIPWRPGCEPEPVPIVTPVPGKRRHYGLLAQQVKQSIDAAGVGDAAFWSLSDADDPESRQALRYEELISPMIKAIQELSDKVTALQGQVDALMH